MIPTARTPEPTAGWARPRRLRVCPSILSADFSRLAQEVAAVEAAGADFLHLDVMDGQFVPALTFGPILVEGVRKLTSLPLDVHLMVVEPMRFLEAFARAGADHFTVHVEAVGDPVGAARAIRERGLRAGLSIKPGTPVERILPALAGLDIALLMTVEPGRGGQPFLPDSPGRIVRLRAAIEAGNHDCVLMVDGGIDPDTAPAAARAGADAFVAGHSIFRAAEGAAEALRTLRGSLAGA